MDRPINETSKESSFNHRKVGMAQTAALHLNQHLPASRALQFDGFDDEGASGMQATAARTENVMGPPVNFTELTADTDEAGCHKLTLFVKRFYKLYESMPLPIEKEKYQLNLIDIGSEGLERMREKRNHPLAGWQLWG